MNIINQSSRNVKPVRIDEVPQNAGRVIYASRQSDRHNAHGHERYKPLLVEAHTRLSPNEPFILHSYTGSGGVSILHNAFYSKNVRAVIEGTYFGWLLDVLESELPSTPGQKLYVIYLTIDRIFRPVTYDPHGGISTWHYTDDDYAVFQMFLDYFFGERTSDIVFAVIDDSHPAKNRSNATKLGQAATGRRGGRPRQINPKEEACRLARENKWNAGRIRRHLFRYKIDASIRAFQLWLKNKGLESPPGRPKKEE